MVFRYVDPHLYRSLVKKKTFNKNCVRSSGFILRGYYMKKPSNITVHTFTNSADITLRNRNFTQVTLICLC